MITTVAHILQKLQRCWKKRLWRQDTGAILPDGYAGVFLTVQTRRRLRQRSRLCNGEEGRKKAEKVGGGYRKALLVDWKREGLLHPADLHRRLLGADGARRTREQRLQGS